MGAYSKSAKNVQFWHARLTVVSHSIVSRLIDPSKGLLLNPIITILLKPNVFIIQLPRIIIDNTFYLPPGLCLTITLEVECIIIYPFSNHFLNNYYFFDFF